MNASEHAPAGQSDVLRSAWKRMVELDIQSTKLGKQSIQLRRWIAILGVVATLLAIVTNELQQNETRNQDWVVTALRIALISVPIVISVIAAYTNKFFSGSAGLVMRAAAEEIKKEIYLYRTVLRNHPQRDRWLNRRMTTIQRRTYKSLGGELIIETYERKLPPYYNPDDPNSDPGFNDLTGDEYICYRVIEQRDWHRRKIIQLKRDRLRIQFYILGMGGLGAFLAALPPDWGLAAWVALTAAFASAFTGWEQLRGRDQIIIIYSRVILELTIIRDEWEAIAPHERTEVDFIQMVRAAENVMWAQSMQYISTMQEAITAGQGDEAELVENMLKEGDHFALDLEDKMLEEAKHVLSEASKELGRVVEDSADMVKGMVTTVTSTATDLQQKVQDSFDSEVEAFEDVVESGLERVTDETAAIRNTITQTVDTSIDEVAATREMVEETTEAALVETVAYRETVGDILETVFAEAASAREVLETTKDVNTTEAEAITETTQVTLDTALDESAAFRETVETSTEALSGEASEFRQVVEANVNLAISESENLRNELDDVTEIREMMEEKIVSEVKKHNKGKDTKISDKLDAMLDEAAEVIDHATDDMRDKMAEEVVEDIIELATDPKQDKQKGVG